MTAETPALRTFDIVVVDGGIPSIALAMAMALGAIGPQPVAAVAVGFDDTGLREWLAHRLPFPLWLAESPPPGRVPPGFDAVGLTIRRRMLGLGAGQRTPRDVHARIFLARCEDDPGPAPKPPARWQGFHFPLHDRGWRRSRCRGFLEGCAPDRFPEIAP